jgi:hypothetical protein
MKILWLMVTPLHQPSSLMSQKNGDNRVQD